jgi:predicted amidophosphoribosyltransferase
MSGIRNERSPILSPRTSKSCASCAADLSKDEEVRLHAIRPNDDGLVRICKRCEQEVVPDPPEPVSHKLERLNGKPATGSTRSSTAGKATMKALRLKWSIEGMCVRCGAERAPASKLCNECLWKARRPKEKSVETEQHDPVPKGEEAG